MYTLTPLTYVQDAAFCSERSTVSFHVVEWVLLKVELDSLDSAAVVSVVGIGIGGGGDPLSLCVCLSVSLSLSLSLPPSPSPSFSFLLQFFFFFLNCHAGVRGLFLRKWWRRVMVLRAHMSPEPQHSNSSPLARASERYPNRCALW